MNGTRILPYATILFLGLGCSQVTGGRHFPADRVDELSRTTTSDDARRILGEPLERHALGPGSEVWVYQYSAVTDAPLAQEVRTRHLELRFDDGRLVDHKLSTVSGAPPADRVLPPRETISGRAEPPAWADEWAGLAEVVYPDRADRR